MNTFERPGEERLELHGDPEHAGIRLMAPLLLLLGGAAGFLLLSSLFGRLYPEAGYGTLLSCLGGLLVGLGVAALGERLLKRHWRSGRKLILDREGVALQQPDEEDRYLSWSGNIAVTCWRFQLKGYPRGGRERNLPSHWYCLGCQMQQGEERIVIHAFMSSDRADRWINLPEFHEIKPSDVYESGAFSHFTLPTRPPLPAGVVSGKDGRYWLAERNRWREGVELTADDFEIFMKRRIAHNV